jgi:hypothetical protein
MNTPRYLVQDNDGTLHAYDREDILKCDLAANRATPPKQLFKLSETSLTISYYPIDITDLIQIPSPPLVLTPAGATALQLEA